MSKATEKSLEDLHGALAKSLKAKIEEGTATAADLAVARQFLKDNGIDAVPRASNPLGQLASSLPFATPDGVDDELSKH